MPRKRAIPRRRICFVTGTRAEFGLMAKTLRAMDRHPKLELQIVVTGMHLDRSRGDSRAKIVEDWKIDATVPWPARANAEPVETARSTGNAIAKLAGVFDKLRSDIVLVVGDRVEAFAAASAAHISNRVVAHVHGGDRALGQVDDALRHAITKLAHVHFPATKASADRIRKLGEVRSRIHVVGSPGIDGIVADAIGREEAVLRGKSFALIVLHPVDVSASKEYERARDVFRTVARSNFDRIVIIYPNNDPGSAGIIRAWREIESDERVIVHRDLARPKYLALLKHAKVLVGNSSSGIIEAASFGVPVIDVGPRQRGRERNANVCNVPYSVDAIDRAVRKAIAQRRSSIHNLYGGKNTGGRIARFLAGLPLNPDFRRKLIAY